MDKYRLSRQWQMSWYILSDISKRTLQSLSALNNFLKETGQRRSHRAILVRLLTFGTYWYTRKRSCQGTRRVCLLTFPSHKYIHQRCCQEAIFVCYTRKRRCHGTMFLSTYTFFTHHCHEAILVIYSHFHHISTHVKRGCHGKVNYPFTYIFLYK